MPKKTVSYDSASPYQDTGLYRLGLDTMVNRPIPKLPDDKLFEIEPQYNFRPDLLAYDLYGNEKLWWVFAARNPSALKDPLFHFVTGNKIYLPTKQTLKTALGI